MTSTKGVDPKIFVAICEKLELNWQEITGLASSPDTVALLKEPNDCVDIDSLVQEVREKIKPYIKKRCGTMRVLDMNQPVGLGDIYTDVNILEKITGRRRLEIAELLQDFDPESKNFDRWGLSGISQERVLGLEAVERYPKLMVLGKPGAGKTTFLKNLAIECCCGNFQKNRIPVFITLKQFAEADGQLDILNFLFQFFAGYKVTLEQISNLLQNGRFLVLLDGLDEVREEDSSKVINQIRDFTEEMFFSNDFNKNYKKFTKLIIYELEKIFLKYFFERSNLYLNKNNVFSKCSFFPKLISLFEQFVKDKNSVVFSKEVIKVFDEYESCNMEAEFYKLISVKSNIIFLKNVYSNFRKSILDIFISSTWKREYIRWIRKNFPTACSLIQRIFTLFKMNKIASFENIKKILEDEIKKVIFEEFIELFHYNYPEKCYVNYFVITCRIAAREEKFENFTEVEVADFDNKQIETFVKKWYRKKEPNFPQLFMQHLKANQPIKELATNPLLLTLLCLVFQEISDFPSNRSELYKEGVAILLKKWDGERLIKRDQVYKKLSPSRKEDLLSQIALITFDRKEYFFKQKDVEQYIAHYIYNLPDAQTEPDALQVESEVVLKSIEAQHGLLIERARGIYSFSHLTFQEYFTARKIVTTSNPQALKDGLQSLANHLTEVRWREVILLALGMLQDADSLLQLMKQYVDGLVAADEKLEEFLVWVSQESQLVENSYKLATVRAFYIANVLCIDFTLHLSYLRNFIFKLTCESNVIFQDIMSLHNTFNLILSPEINHDLTFTLAPEFKQALQTYKNQLPNTTFHALNEWWKANGQTWAIQLKEVLIKPPISKGWQFSKQQKEYLKQYYNANKLLVDYLNSDCYVSRKVRQEIEDTLLLPVS